MHSPFLDTRPMKILLAGVAVLQSFLRLVHLSEADNTILVIFQIDFLVLLRLLLPLDPRFEPFVEILVEFIEGSLWYLGLVCESLEYFFVLRDLSHNKVDMLARLSLGAEVEASAGHGSRHLGCVDPPCCPDHVEGPPFFLTLGFEQEDPLVAAAMDALEFGN